MGLSASSTSWRSPGAILDAQPAQAAYEVSRTSAWVCLAIAGLRRVRRGLRFDELDERPLERFARARAGLAHDEGLALDVGERHGVAVRPRVPRRDDDDELVGH